MTPEQEVARLGYMTASVAAKIMGALTTDGLASLVKHLAWERVHGNRNEENYQSAAMLRGNEVEELALNAYEFTRDVILVRGEFVKHPTIPFVGASPDGYIDRGDAKEPVEAKSMLVSAFMDVLKSGEVPSEYRWQCRWQAWCCGSDHTDFVAWHPSRPPIIIPFELEREHVEQMTARVAVVESRIREWMRLLSEK